MNIASAKRAAENLSKQARYYNTPLYVNWIESDAWSVDIAGELGEMQEYCINGNWIYPHMNLTEVIEYYD